MNPVVGSKSAVLVTVLSVRNPQMAETQKMGNKRSSLVAACRWDSWIGHISTRLILLTHYLWEFSDIISPSKSFCSNFNTNY